MANRQAAEFVFKSLILGRIGGKSTGGESRKDFVPKNIQNRLHIAGTAGDGDDSVLARHNDTILTESTVTSVGAVPAAPELVAIALIPIAFWITAVGCLDFGGRLDPTLGNDFFAIPFSFLKIELTEFGNILGPEI